MILPPFTATILDNSGTATQATPGLTFPAATTVQQNITVQRQNKQPVDLTGCALVITFRSKVGGPLLFKHQATITNPSTGQAYFIIAWFDTCGLRGSYVYDIELVYPDQSTDQAVPVSPAFITDALYNPNEPISILSEQLPIGVGPPGFGQMQSPAGANLPQRPKVSVDGTLLLATDNPSQNRTDITAPGLTPITRQILAGAGLTGGGTLSADRTLAVVYGIAANTATQGNDVRLPPTPTTVGNILVDGGASYVSIPGPTLNAAQFAGADWGAKVGAAIAALPATGGTIDARSLSGAHVISSTIVVDRPVYVHKGASQITCSVSPAFSVTASVSPSKKANFRLEGIDPASSTITSAPGGTIIQMSGDFFNTLGIGAQQLTIRSMGLFGSGVIGDGSCALNTQSFPTTNFESGTITIEKCLISQFGGTAINIGTSVYFTRIHDNEILTNNQGAFIGPNSEVSIWKNQFYQMAGATLPTLTLGSLMAVVDHNYFYRASIVDTSNQPDILLRPEGATPSQSGGYDWIINNRFGGEHENFDPARVRILMHGASSTITAGGPMDVSGNKFLGGSSTATYSATGTTLTVTLGAGRTTQGLIPGSNLVLTSATSAVFNGPVQIATVVDSLNFTVTIPAVGGTLTGTLVVFSSDQAAIRIDNPHLQWDVSGNYFAGYATLINDNQNTPSSPLAYGQSIFARNRVSQLAPGYRVFANGGKLFTHVEPPGDAPDARINNYPRNNEVASGLQNRLYRTEALDLWAQSNGIVTTTGQTDPYGTTRAVLLTNSGTTPSSQHISNQIDRTGAVTGQRLCIKFWARAAASSTVAVGVFDSTTGSFQGSLRNFNLTSQWKQYQFWTAPINVSNVTSLLVYPGDSSYVSGSIYFFAPQASDSDTDYIPNTNAGALTQDLTAGVRMETALRANTLRADPSTTLTLDAAAGINAAGPITFTGTSTLSGAAGLNLNAPSGTLAFQVGGANILSLTSTTLDILQFAHQAGNKTIAVTAAAPDTAGVTLTLQGQAAGNAATADGQVGGTTIVAGGIGSAGTASFNPGKGGTLDLLGGAAGTGGTGNANGGNIVVRGGAPQGTGVGGTLLIGDANTSSITMGSSTTALTINGTTPSIVGASALTLDSGSGTLAMRVGGANKLTLTSAATDVLSFAGAAGNKFILAATAAVDTAGTSMTVQAANGGVASAVGGGGGGSMTVQPGTGGNGTAALNPGAGASLILQATPGGTGGTGNSSAGSVFIRAALGNGTGTDGNVNIGQSVTNQILIGSATGRAGAATTTIFGGNLTFPAGSIAIAALSADTYTVSAGTGLGGGGSAVLGVAAAALTVTYGNTASTSTQGNDSRLPPAPSQNGNLIYDTGSAYATVARGATNTVLLGNGAAPPSFGAVPNAALANSTITVTGNAGIAVGSSPVALGGTLTVAVDQSFSPAWTGNHTWSNALLGSGDNTVNLGAIGTRWASIYAFNLLAGNAAASGVTGSTLAVTGQTGGVGAASTNAGNGGLVTMTSGVGGAAGTSASTPGNGGTFTLQGGGGGSANTNQGNGNVGGTGALVRMIGGVGGVGDQSTNSNGGVGGAAQLIGGTGANASTGTGTGGAGGLTSILGGPGGAGSATGIAGGGGGVSIQSGAGGSAVSNGGHGGTGGLTQLIGGTAGAGAATGNVQGGIGGGVTITTGAGAAAAGTATGTAPGSVIIQIGTVGAAGVSASGGAAGTISITSGSGAAGNGANVATVGGSSTISGGTGGAGTASVGGANGGAANNNAGNGGAAGGGGGAAGNGGTAQTSAGNGGAGNGTDAGGTGGIGRTVGGNGGAGTATGLGGAGGAASLIGGAPGTNNGAGSGLGGAVNLSSGSGTAANGTSAGTGGGSIQSGFVNATGVGGAASTSVGGTAGAGGLLNLGAGSGGIGAASTNGGGLGGNAQIQAGTGGAGGTATTGGAGGISKLTGGTGGASAGVSGTAGAGGALIIVSGAAGAAAGGTGAASGNVTIDVGTGTSTNGTISIGAGANSPLTITLGKNNPDATSNIVIAAPVHLAIPKTVGGSIASASTIAPTAPIHHVTGTTAIVTITAPASFAQTSNGGQLTLIPDGLWTWTAAGNIALAGSAVVSKALIMTYDNTTAKWYPSYTS